MNIRHLGVLALASLLLTGCGLFKDRTSDYLKAEELPPTVVPEGLDSSALGQIYPIPAVGDVQAPASNTETPRPLPVSVNVFEELVKIQTLGGERWILTNRPPSETWPRVRNILNTSGIPVAKADAAAGVIDTVWLQFKDDDVNNHRFRFTIEPGIQLNSTEIRVLHAQADAAGDMPEEWPTVSDSDEREKSMVESFASLLAGDLSSSTVSLLAQTIGGKPKVDILTPRLADPYMVIKTDYARSWASVAYSLERGGFTTIDKDQTEGVFYVNYRSEDEDKPGFFKRLFSGKEDEVLKVNYLVLVAKGEDAVEVRVVNADRSSLDPDLALQLLKNVRNNLS